MEHTIQLVDDERDLSGSCAHRGSSAPPDHALPSCQNRLRVGLGNKAMQGLNYPSLNRQRGQPEDGPWAALLLAPLHAAGDVVTVHAAAPAIGVHRCHGSAVAIE